jgi:hypothetical protein
MARRISGITVEISYCKYKTSAESRGAIILFINKTLSVLFKDNNSVR